ncbi:unnamed protein product [Lactuca saligna]|uniref:Uncharacterized protein n=1 Tax=Lactuca saligna TaxID=75948 RepID=A0AA35YYY2_LACSI|nr:unnamed protein product [Lactuca saligna]
MEGPKSVNDDEIDNGGFVGSFAYIEFDPIEEDIPDHMLMYGKKFKILNRKINSLLHLQADGCGKHSVSGIESNELRVKAQSKTFNSAFRDLKDIAKARHVLHVQYVKTVRENVNFKIHELRDDMANELSVLNHNHSTLHMKLDIIVDSITKAIEWYNSLVPKFDKKVELDATSFGDMAKLIAELKELLPKSGSLTSLIFTPEFFNQKITLLESILHKELAPLAKPLPIVPTGAPPVVT